MPPEDTAVSDAPSTTEITTPTDATIESDSGAPNEDVQGQSEDSFFDPTTIPDELKPAYKQMQGAFTKKTQEIANVRKEHEALMQEKQQWDKYQQYIPVLDEMLTPSQPQTQGELNNLKQQLAQAGYSDEAIEMMTIGAQFVLNQFQGEKQRELQVQEQTRQEQSIAEAEKLDPRLSDETASYQLEDGSKVSFAEIVAGIVHTTPNWRKDIVGSTKRAIAVVDAMTQRARLEGKEELSTSARTKANRFPTSATSPQSSISDSQPMSIREAWKQAQAEQGN